MSTAIAVAEGAHFEINDEWFIVGPKCDENAGTWICVTHGEYFQHNWAKDTHIGDPGDHVLAWGCFTHGPEVP